MIHTESPYKLRPSYTTVGLNTLLAESVPVNE